MMGKKNKKIMMPTSDYLKKRYVKIQTAVLSPSEIETCFDKSNKGKVGSSLEKLKRMQKKNKKITGTKEAFLQMLLVRGVYKKLEISRSAVAMWKAAIVANDDKKTPTLDTMEKMLFRYGATVEKEKVWNVKVTVEDEK